MALYFFLGGNIKQLTRRAELITKILENNLHYDNNDHYCFLKVNLPSELEKKTRVVAHSRWALRCLVGWISLGWLLGWMLGCPWVARNSIGASLPSAGGLTRILRLPPSSPIFSFPILIFQNLFVCGPTCNHPPPFFSFFSFLLELFSSLLPLLFLYLNQPTWTMLPSHW